jgi:hypothetical protein
MLELNTTFTPADGSPPRSLTLRISDVRPDPDGHTWSAAVDILGFEYDERRRIKQADWTWVIRDSALFLARRVRDKVELAGGGTLDPHIDFPKD